MTLDELIARECVDLATCFADDGVLEVKGRFTAQSTARIG